MKYIINSAANQNGETAQKVSNGDFQPDFSALETNEIQDSAMSKIINNAKQNIACAATNDNNPNKDGGGDDNTPSPSPTGTVIEDIVEDDEGNSYQVYIDVEEVSKRTHFSQNQLVKLCSGTNTTVTIPTNLTELNTFITVNQGAATTAGALAKKNKLPPETRLYFLRKAQEYGYLWLKGEVQLGNEIRKIATRMGKRTDLEAANDNEKKQRNTADLDKVLTELRTKKEILAEDYNIGYTQARQLTRLTDELVEKELKYAIANNDTLSRNHALSFLSQPPELTDEEKEAADTNGTKAKAKFKFETVFSDIPFSKRQHRRLKTPLFYTSIAACIGSDEYYLEDHGLVCKVALEPEPNRADYFTAMHKMRSKHDVKMIVGKLEDKYDELLTAFKESGSKLLKCTIPCQCFCTMHGKNWKDDERLLIVLDCVKFIKDALPDHILFENAKEFFGFSLPMSKDLSTHPIAARLQQELNGRTIGEYLKDELTADGLNYNLNFAIENACYYGTAQSRVRSILLGSRKGVWKFPKAEEFAMPLWKAIGDLPSLEAGEDSGIPYHYAKPLHPDPIKAAKIAEALAHTATGRCPIDNDPKYQLSGFGFFGAKGGRKFWDKPSNTIDGGNGNILGLRTVHPGRLRKDGTYSDARPFTLLEVFLTNGLPKDYKVPVAFRDKEAFIREVMGEIFLPRMLERICLELPISDEDWNNQEKSGK